MFSRQVGTSLLRLPRSARLPIRSLPQQQCQYDLAVRAVASPTQRSYAQITPSRPGRPKKAVGEPSRPVKRAVKQAAKSPKEDAATQLVKARKKTAQEKKEKSAAKPKAKKKPAVSADEKAQQAERRAKRKASSAKRLERASMAELKKVALDPPPVKILTAWVMFLRHRLQPGAFKGTSPLERKAEFAQAAKDAQVAYKNVTPAELEHYNHLVHTEVEKQQADYKQYVESHTVEEIEAANKARATLRKKLNAQKNSERKWKPIKDERSVKKPLAVYAQFTANRYASGDFKDISLGDAGKLIGQEWKALSEGEKKKYKDLYDQDKTRYIDEYTSVFGHGPGMQVVSAGQQAQAAAAAA